MKFLKKLFIVLLILVIILLIIAVMLPSKRHVEASLNIDTPAKYVYEQVVNFKNWDKWTPFRDNDTAMKISYSGPHRGVGAIMSWVSEKEGNGSMTITEVIPNKKIKTRIDFEGWGSSFSEWVFVDSNNSTKVIWTMSLENLGFPVGRYMGLMMSSMIKKSFEKGLARLKKVSEDYAKTITIFSTSDISIKETNPKFALVIKDSSECDEVGELYERVFSQLGQFVGMNKIEMDGPPFSICYLWDTINNKFVCETGFYVKEKTNGKDNIKFIELPKQKVVSAIHTGSYDMSGKTHEALDRYIADKKLQVVGPPVEVYILGQDAEPDMTKWQTEIYYPVK